MPARRITEREADMSIQSPSSPSARIILRPPAGAAGAEVERRIGVLEAAWDIGAVRKVLIIVVLAAVWQAYGVYLDNPLLFPSLTETLQALAENVRSGVLPARAWSSASGAADGLCGRGFAGGHPHHCRHQHAHRLGLPRDRHSHAEPAAGHRAAAAGADLVRPRQRQSCLHPCPFGAVAGGAQHPLGLPAVSQTLRMVGATTA